MGIQLWVWLPPGAHLGDYKILFATQSDGYKLSELYNKCQEQTNLILIIKTTKNEIFGVFCSQLDDPMKIDKFAPLRKRIKDSKLLLFQLHPAKPQCYYPQTDDHFYHQSRFSMKNMHTQRSLDMDEVEDDLIEIINEKKEDYEKEVQSSIPVVFPSKDSLTFGDADKECLFLDCDLNYGFSHECAATFGCPSFVQSNDGQFQVSEVEVWSVSCFD